MQNTDKHPIFRPAKIISGGQTGVDRGALDAAIALGIPHGGWCPRGRLAEDGTIPCQYRLQESDSPEYHVRTELNVRDSDGTMILFVGACSAAGAADALVSESSASSEATAEAPPNYTAAQPSSRQTDQPTQQSYWELLGRQPDAAEPQPGGGRAIVGAQHADRLRGGTKLTYELAAQYRRPLMVVDLDHPPPLVTIYQWLEQNRIAVLNVAGPRESQSPGIARRTFEFLKDLFGPRTDMW